MSARIRTLVTAFLAILPGALVAQGAGRADLIRDLERLDKGERIAGLPPADSVTPGPRTVNAGTTASGTIVAQGPIHVYGRVEGSAVSLGGDVVVHPGGVVGGDAVAVGGRVLADSGQVLGDMRAMATLPTQFASSALVVAPVSAAQRTMDAVKFVIGTFIVLLCIALGVLLFAGPNLDSVVRTIEGQFVLTFWYGLLGQVVALPVLCIIVVALALSLIGILLIPFAIVAYAIAAAGLVTLGFLGIARVIGGSVWHGTDATARSRALGSLAVGLALFFVLWITAAALTWAPLAATVVRAAALAATWAAMTLGLGAAIISRAGTHKRIAGSGSAKPVELAAWQTPTPVAGVLAARRTVGAREGR